VPTNKPQNTRKGTGLREGDSLKESLFKILKSKLVDDEGKLLKDGKSDDAQTLVDLVSAWEDASTAKEKVQKINTELKAEKEKLQGQIDEAKSGSSDLEKKVAELSQNQLTNEQKKILDDAKAGNTVARSQLEDLQTKLNTAEVEIGSLKSTNSELTAMTETQKKAYNEAVISSARGDIKSQIVGVLATRNISGKLSEFITNDILGSGSVEITTGEDGTSSKWFNIIDGKKCDSDMNNVVESYLKNNEDVIPASGSKGSGTDHTAPPVGKEFNAAEVLATLDK